MALYPLRRLTLPSVFEFGIAVEEGFARGQVEPQEVVLLIKQLQHRVEQQRQDVECGQKRSQMLLTVPKIVFQVVALGLKGVIVLVLHLPPGAPC